MGYWSTARRRAQPFFPLTGLQNIVATFTVAPGCTIAGNLNFSRGMFRRASGVVRGASCRARACSTARSFTVTWAWREHLRSRLARDWLRDLATIYAAYPGIDPMRLTVIRFIGLVDLAQSVHCKLNLAYTRDAEDAEGMNKMAREIAVMDEFPALAD
jgi:hypothetical protein